MAYITNADIEERLGTTVYVQLTDDSGTGSADLDKVDEARLGAEGEADSYLGLRYAVPVDLTVFGETAAVLKSFVLDLAAYRLHSRRPPVLADVGRRRNEAVNWFRRVADGGVVLPVDKEVTPSSSVGTRASVTGAQRVMSRDELSDL